jgi:CheY-like chemotaxis protein
VLLYHVVGAAKYRWVVFSEHGDEVPREACIEIAKRYEIVFLEIEMDRNHVHFLKQLIPTCSPTKMVRTVKSLTAEDTQKTMLLADDNPADVHLLQHAVLEHGKLPWRIYGVHDGEAALAFLQQHGLYADVPRPALVILDIRLPKLDGWEVLKIIRATPTLATIPVAMVAGIISAQDGEQREALQPTACLVKPTELEAYAQLVRALEQLLATLPHKG